MTHFIVQTSSAKMPSSCRGRYGNVAVLEVEDGVEHASMISERSKDVVQIVRFWGPCSIGKTSRSAFSRAFIEATELAARLNRGA